MDSPSLDAPRPPVHAQREHESGAVSPRFERPDRARAGTLIVFGFGNPVAAEYAAFVSQNSPATRLVADGATCAALKPSVRAVSMSEFSHAAPETGGDPGHSTGLVLFINSALTARDRGELDDILAVSRAARAEFVGIVSTFRFHLDDPAVEEAENYVQSRAASFARVVVFRPGHMLSRHSSIGKLLDRLAPFYPLFPGSLYSCFIDAASVFTAIETERLGNRRRAQPDDRWRTEDEGAKPNLAGRPVGVHHRTKTLLGSNVAWRDLLARHRARGGWSAVTTGVSTVLSWLMVGPIFAGVVALLARRYPWWRQWNVHTLEPRSLGELLALCHRDNFDHVKVVGYNNGVVHFGHRHPGKTIVSTVRCRRTARGGPLTLKADCGTTVRGALDFLARDHQELYVVPNYSYVCLGTSFFVPIHGSAVDYSTVADTICRVVFYDPDSDRIVSAARADEAFRAHVYDQKSRIVVLRLYLVVKPKSSYFVHRQALRNASANEILSALRDATATNVEIRQGSASSNKVTVARYYKSRGDTSSPALELPRDALGRLWDRLEENPISSYLMHALSRRVAWHTELFFTVPEFALFWRTHAQLPLRKIQLRYLKRDGLPHSPFRDEDCVSADLFIFRWQRSRFLGYLRENFPTIRTNPGKHSH